MEHAGVELPLYLDIDGRTNDALRGWEPPTYFVVDAPGTLRFTRVPRTQVLRYVSALMGPGRR